LETNKIVVGHDDDAVELTVKHVRSAASEIGDKIFLNGKLLIFVDHLPPSKYLQKYLLSK
jgi:hypothetical protein